MKKDYMSHLFVPPEKSFTERISDAVDDKISKLFGLEKSPRRIVKKTKDKIILRSREHR